MLNWLTCYLTGRHDFGVWCEPGTIFLRCVHCGRRSGGWSLAAKPQEMTRKKAARAPRIAQVLRFDRRAAAVR